MGLRNALGGLSLAALMACGSPPPAPLPAAVVPLVDARMVATRKVHGYLARPLHPAVAALPAILLEVDHLDDAAKAAAREAATPVGQNPGAVVLVVPAVVGEAEARAYLDGLGGVAPPATVRNQRGTPSANGSP